MKNTYLSKILEVTKISVAEKKKTLPLNQISSSSEKIPPTRGFMDALKTSIEINKVAVIAEMKKPLQVRDLLDITMNPQS